jgi:hypothetical protein
MLRPAALTTAALALAVALGSGPARAAVTGDEATPELDQRRLAQGDAVTYPQTVYYRGKRYVGGVSYAIVDASADELLQLLGDMSAYTEVLPHARTARLVGQKGDDHLVEITQGTSFVTAAYTLRLRADHDRQEVRFWLDRSRPHGIDDAWGYFRVTPLPAGERGQPRVLLSYGILVDLGPGLVRDLFEARIQASMLSVPERLRVYAAARFRAHGRA